MAQQLWQGALAVGQWALEHPMPTWYAYLTLVGTITVPHYFPNITTSRQPSFDPSPINITDIDILIREVFKERITYVEHETDIRPDILGKIHYNNFNNKRLPVKKEGCMDLSKIIDQSFRDREWMHWLINFYDGDQSLNCSSGDFSSWRYDANKFWSDMIDNYLDLEPNKLMGERDCSRPWSYCQGRRIQPHSPPSPKEPEFKDSETVSPKEPEVAQPGTKSRDTSTQISQSLTRTTINLTATAHIKGAYTSIAKGKCPEHAFQPFPEYPTKTLTICRFSTTTARRPVTKAVVAQPGTKSRDTSTQISQSLTRTTINLTATAHIKGAYTSIAKEKCPEHAFQPFPEYPTKTLTICRFSTTTTRRPVTKAVVAMVTVTHHASGRPQSVFSTETPIIDQETSACQLPWCSTSTLTEWETVTTSSLHAVTTSSPPTPARSIRNYIDNISSKVFGSHYWAWPGSRIRSDNLERQERPEKPREERTEKPNSWVRRLRYSVHSVPNWLWSGPLKIISQLVCLISLICNFAWQICVFSFKFVTDLSSRLLGPEMNIFRAFFPRVSCQIPMRSDSSSLCWPLSLLPGSIVRESYLRLHQFSNACEYFCLTGGVGSFVSTVSGFKQSFGLALKMSADIIDNTARFFGLERLPSQSLPVSTNETGAHDRTLVDIYIRRCLIIAATMIVRGFSVFVTLSPNHYNYGYAALLTFIVWFVRVIHCTSGGFLWEDIMSVFLGCMAFKFVHKFTKTTRPLKSRTTTLPKEVLKSPSHNPLDSQRCLLVVEILTVLAYMWYFLPCWGVAYQCPRWGNQHQAPFYETLTLPLSWILLVFVLFVRHGYLLARSFSLEAGCWFNPPRRPTQQQRELEHTPLIWWSSLFMAGLLNRELLCLDLAFIGFALYFGINIYRFGLGRRVATSTPADEIPLYLRFIYNPKTSLHSLFGLQDVQERSIGNRLSLSWRSWRALFYGIVANFIVTASCFADDRCHAVIELYRWPGVVLLTSVPSGLFLYRLYCHYHQEATYRALESVVQGYFWVCLLASVLGYITLVWRWGFCVYDPIEIGVTFLLWSLVPWPAGQVRTLWEEIPAFTLDVMLRRVTVTPSVDSLLSTPGQRTYEVGPGQTTIVGPTYRLNVINHECGDEGLNDNRTEFVVGNASPVQDSDERNEVTYEIAPGQTIPTPFGFNIMATSDCRCDNAPGCCGEKEEGEGQGGKGGDKDDDDKASTRTGQLPRTDKVKLLPSNDPVTASTAGSIAENSELPIDASQTTTKSRLFPPPGSTSKFNAKPITARPFDESPAVKNFIALVQERLANDAANPSPKPISPHSPESDDLHSAPGPATEPNNGQNPRRGALRKALFLKHNGSESQTSTIPSSPESQGKGRLTSEEPNKDN